MGFKKCFFFIVGFTIIGLLAIAGFNYRMDPAGMFRSDQYEAGIADIIVSKQNVANLSDYDERLVQKYILEKGAQKLDVLVLGSSRTMQIHGYLFPGQSFFNNSVSSAALEDDIAIFDMYKERNLLPKKVILGLDPWLLNGNNELHAWETLRDQYYAGASYLGIDIKNEKGSASANTRQYRKYMELISMPYLKASMDSWKKRSKGMYYPTQETDLPESIRFADGALGYPASKRNISVEDAHKAAMEFNKNELGKFLGNFDKLDERNMDKFVRFVEYMQNQGIEVVFFLSPYHPLVYENIVNDPKYAAVLKTENYFREFAKEHNIVVMGDYDPTASNLSDDGFYDGMHPKTESINKIFAAQRAR